MEREKIILDEPSDDVETIDSSNQNDEQVQQYLDERNAEKKQIDSFRSICRVIVAILFVIALIAGIRMVQVQTALGVGVIIVSVLVTILLEKFIDIVCNLFVDVKAIRIQLWKNSQK